MNNLVLRELLNGGLIPLTLCILVVISIALWRSYREHGKGWTQRPGVAAACALWWIFLADGIRAVFVWITLSFENDGRSSAFLGSYRTAAFMIAAGIAAAATFRLVYVLSAEPWGHKGWIFSAIFTAGFVIATQLI